MKTYTVRSRTSYWFYVVAMPCFSVATAILWVGMVTSQWQRADTVGVLFGLTCVGWLGRGIRRYLQIPHTIELVEAGPIRFIGALRDTTIQPSDVLSVSSFAGQFIYLKHARGKILMLAQFTGFHEFLTELKHANPQVVMRGV